ncbi:hypothetical protein pb186bvf_018627 [Paramecium bursaria]
MNPVQIIEQQEMKGKQKQLQILILGYQEILQRRIILNYISGQTPTGFEWDSNNPDGFMQITVEQLKLLKFNQYSKLKLELELEYFNDETQFQIDKLQMNIIYKF